MDFFRISWSLQASENTALLSSYRCISRAPLEWRSPSCGSSVVHWASFGVPPRVCSVVSRRYCNPSFAEQWAHGQSLSRDQARTEAEDVLTALAHSPSSAIYPAGLSQREVEVLRLVATGLTDAQVAERLVLSTRTVSTHLRSIYSKLEVTSRHAATRFALEHDLI